MWHRPPPFVLPFQVGLATGEIIWIAEETERFTYIRALVRQLLAWCAWSGDTTVSISIERSLSEFLMLGRDFRIDCASAFNAAIVVVSSDCRDSMLLHLRLGRCDGHRYIAVADRTGIAMVRRSTACRAGSPVGQPKKSYPPRGYLRGAHSPKRNAPVED